MGSKVFSDVEGIRSNPIIKAKKAHFISIREDFRPKTHELDELHVNSSQIGDGIINDRVVIIRVMDGTVIYEFREI